MQVLVYPLELTQEIVVLPLVKALTLPEEETEATLELEEDHFLTEAPVSLRVNVSPLLRETVYLFNLGLITRTLALATLLPTVALITTEPGFLALTRPLELTVAIEVLPETHLAFLEVPRSFN